MNYKTDIIVKHRKKGFFGFIVSSDIVPGHGVRNLTKFCNALNLNYHDLLSAIGRSNDKGETSCKFDGWTFSWMSDAQWHDFMSQYGIETNGERNQTIIDAPVSSNYMTKKDMKFMEQTYARATDW